MKTAILAFTFVWMLVAEGTVYAQPMRTETVLPAFGGGGGGPYQERCPSGAVVRGLQLRTGVYVDAVQPVCGTEPYGPSHGGMGGGPARLMCPPRIPALIGVYVVATGEKTVVVSSLGLLCGTDRGEYVPNRPFDAAFEGRGWVSGGGFPSHFGIEINDTKVCPSGMVVTGIHGNSGQWVDSLGLICGFIHVLQTEGGTRGIGRRSAGPVDPGTPRKTACQSAKAVRDLTINPVSKTAMNMACLRETKDNGRPNPSACVIAKRAVGTPIPTKDFAGLIGRCLDSVR